LFVNPWCAKCLRILGPDGRIPAARKVQRLAGGLMALCYLGGSARSHRWRAWRASAPALPRRCGASPRPPPVTAAPHGSVAPGERADSDAELSQSSTAPSTIIPRSRLVSVFSLAPNAAAQLHLVAQHVCGFSCQLQALSQISQSCCSQGVSMGVVKCTVRTAT